MLGLSIQELSCVLFKSKVCFLQPSGSHTEAPLAFKAKCFRGSPSCCRAPRLGSQCAAWTPHSWGRTFAIVVVLSFVSRLFDDVGLDHPSSPSFLPCGSFFISLGFPAGLAGKESACNAGDLGNVGMIPGSGRSPGEGHSNPLRCSCLENPMDREAWWATGHRFAKSRT